MDWGKNEASQQHVKHPTSEAMEVISKSFLLQNAVIPDVARIQTTTMPKGILQANGAKMTSSPLHRHDLTLRPEASDILRPQHTDLIIQMTPQDFPK